MSHRIRIATIVATLTAMLTVASAGAAAAPHVAAPPATDPGVDYHPVHLHLKPTSFAGIALANCTDTFFSGSGHCDGAASSSPDLGGWSISWQPCGSPPAVLNCPPGSIAIKIYSSGNHLYGWMYGGRYAELYITDADVPAWHPLSAITSESSGAAGQKDGPLYIDVYHSWGDRYTVDIRGYMLYKKLDKSFDLSGYLDYGTTDEPLANRAFHAKLNVLDTPSSPKCNAPFLGGAGGCYGAFTNESDAPFRGEGGSIHWHQGNPTAVELIAPSGSKLDGNIDGSADRLEVTSGNVPEWNVNTSITTSSYSGKTGEKGGPLRMTMNPCCGKPSASGPPHAKIKRERISQRRHRASFRFRGSGGTGTLYLGCKLDDRPFRSCARSTTYRHLKNGRHVFRVKAKDSAGKSSLKSAKVKFRI